MTAADLYLRLSDLRAEDLEADGTSASLAHKETQLRGLAARLGWDVRRVVIENDAPELAGRNGKSRNASAFKRRKIRTPSGRVEWRVFRPGFRRLIEDIEAGRIGAMIAEDLDRVCRDPRDLEDLADVMRGRGANARSLSGSLSFTDGGTDAELLTARIMVAVANKSSADTARRVAQARERQAVTGKWGGGRRPFGFADDGVTVVRSEAEVIREAAAAVLAAPVSHAARCDPALAETDGTVTLKALARSLRERGVPTVTGAQWSAETLRSILMRPRNAGIAVHRGAEVDVPEDGRPRWMREPILPPGQWRAVAAVLSDESQAHRARQRAALARLGHLPVRRLRRRDQRARHRRPGEITGICLQGALPPAARRRPAGRLRGRVHHELDGAARVQGAAPPGRGRHRRDGAEGRAEEVQ